MHQYSFKSKGHKYYKDGDNSDLISVTALVGLYTKEFKEDYWSLYKAYEELLFRHISSTDIRKNMFREMRKKIGFKLGSKEEFRKFNKLIPPEDAQLRAKEIRDRWEKDNKRSQEKGTKYHEYHENKAKAEGKVENPFTGEIYDYKEGWKMENGVKKNIVDLNNLPDGFYSELIVESKGIIGQIDRLWVKDGSIYIRDFKSNKKIERENRFQKMKYPVNHLDDCNYNHYKLQLNLYAWVLSNYNYMCEGLALDHYNREYILDINLNEVEQLVTDYKIKKQLG